MKKIQEQNLTVKAAQIAIANRIAPVLSQIFQQGERPADHLDVLQTALHRGLVAMQGDFLGVMPRPVRTSGRHSLLCRESP
jgi:hypothetical protein